MSEAPYRERLRATALEIATRIVEAEGLAALQARRVATDAGCSVGTLYNIFGGMDDLVTAVNRDTLRLLGEALVTNFTATHDRAVEQRLTDLALTYLRFARQHMLRWRAVFEHRRGDGAEPPADYRAEQARLLALIETVVAGEIADTDARRRAGRALFAAIHGIVLLAVDEKLANYDHTQTEGEIRFIVSATANGLARAGG